MQFIVLSKSFFERYASSVSAVSGFSSWRPFFLTSLQGCPLVFPPASYISSWEYPGSRSLFSSSLTEDRQRFLDIFPCFPLFPPLAEGLPFFTAAVPSTFDQFPSEPNSLSLSEVHTLRELGPWRDDNFSPRVERPCFSTSSFVGCSASHSVLDGKFLF